MKIVILVKQVPDMEKVKFDREKGVIDRNSAGVEINPFDLNALESALQIKDKIGATVVALSMGPPRGSESLTEAVSRGADDAYLLTDRRFGGADVKATSKTLVAGIKAIGDVDLIISGLQSVDGDTGQVGSEVAQYLGIPGICSVIKVKEFDENSITVVTDLWGGQYVKNVQYPALLTITKDANVPRLPSFKDKMRARKAEIHVWNYEDIKDFVTPEEIGINGSSTVVKKIEVPMLQQREGKIFRDDLVGAMNEFTKMLKQNKIVGM